MAHSPMTPIRIIARTRSRLGVVAVLVVALMTSTGGVALGLVGGKRVSISSVPWTVVVWGPFSAGESRHAQCTGVIIDATHVLTAAHCVMSGNSATPLPPSSFRIEAGVSNPSHPLASDAPQFRAVTKVRSMPGYIAENKIRQRNWIKAAGYDVAVMTLSQPLDLSGKDAKAAYLPKPHTPPPSLRQQMVLAGYGTRKQRGLYADGALSESPTLLASDGCTSRVLCVLTTGVCWGDTGAPLVEPGPDPTVIGILSQDPLICEPEYDRYASLIAPAVRRFIEASLA
jgi:hypothetical protein